MSGALEFDLPAGLLLYLMLYAVRRYLLNWLPPLFSAASLPASRWSARSCWIIPVSLLVGIWTHLLLDSATHLDGWLVLHSSLLQLPVSWFGLWRVQLFKVLYYVFTFLGSGCVALCYWNWLETMRNPAGRDHPGAPGTAAGVSQQPGSTVPEARWLAKWVGCTLFGVGTVLVAAVTRGENLFLAPALASLICAPLIAGSLVLTAPRRPGSNISHRRLF